MRYIRYSPIILLAFLLSVGWLPKVVWAMNGVPVTITTPPLSYVWTASESDEKSGSIYSPVQDPSGYETALSAGQVTATYEVAVLSGTNSQPISNGTTLTVGAPVILYFYNPATNDSISWSATGYGDDSPVGEWSTQSGSGISEACDSNDYVSQETGDSGSNGPDIFNIYAPLSITPPPQSSVSFSTTGLTCGAETTDSYGGYDETCTVNNVSNVSATVNIGATTGTFYYRWQFAESNGTPVSNGACDGNGTPLFSSPGNSDVCTIHPTPNGPVGVCSGSFTWGTTYSLPVPATSYNYSFPVTGSTPGDTANVPTISGPTDLASGQSGTYTFTGTDTGGYKVNYGINWENDVSTAGVEQWLPNGTGVPSGTAQSASQSWTNTGTTDIGEYISALTQDQTGAQSAWSPQYFVKIEPAPPTADLIASPASISSGSSSTLSYYCTGSNGASIDQGVGTVTGTNGQGYSNVYGNVTVSPTTTTKYTLTCTNSNKNTSATYKATVSVVAPLANLVPESLAPSSVTAGTPATFTGTIKNTGDADTPSFESTIYFCPSGDTTCQNSIALGPIPHTSWFRRALAFFFPKAFAQSAQPIAVTTNYTTITAGNSGTQTGTYTFPIADAGNYSMTLCADDNGSGVGTVTESPPSPHCGSWQLVVVGPASIGGSCSTPSATVPINTPVTWTANPSGGNGTYSYAWSGADGLTGTTQSVTQSYATPGTYGATVSITSDGENTAPACTAGGNGTVQVCGVTLSSNPSTIDVGQSTTLSWSVPSACASSCQFADQGTSVGISGTRSVTPAAPTSGTTDTYGITCGSYSANTAVTVLTPSAAITAAPNRVVAGGGPITVTYSANDVNSCSVTRNGSAESSWNTALTSGSLASTTETDTTPITSQTTYTITCTTNGSPVSASAIVNIGAAYQEF